MTGIPRLRESARRPQGVIVLGTGLLAFGAALAVFAMHATHPAFGERMYDLMINRDAGLIVRHAYVFPPGQSTDLYDWFSSGGNPFTYPPFAAILFALLSYLPLGLAQWTITAAGIAALLATCYLALAATGWRASWRALCGVALAVAAVAMWTQPVQVNFALGQINVLLLVAVVWDLRPGRAGDAGRWAGIATGIAAGIKLTPLIFIPYLLLTRRFRAAGLAMAAFAVTVAVGFAVLPSDSVAYWGTGLAYRANGGGGLVEFFFASPRNQSIRALLTRLVQHTQAANRPWLVAFLLVGMLGLWCAARLDRSGYPVLGVLTCGLTGLLISPVSWDHHWVWVAPWLAALTGLALATRGRMRWAWGGVAVLVALAFAQYPRWPLLPGRRGLGLIRDVPLKHPFAWHGLTLIAGNLYPIGGLIGLAALSVWAARLGRRPAAARVAAEPGAGGATTAATTADGHAELDQPGQLAATS